jgi:hypothetical protein
MHRMQPLQSASPADSMSTGHTWHETTQLHTACVDECVQCYNRTPSWECEAWHVLVQKTAWTGLLSGTHNLIATHKLDSPPPSGHFQACHRGGNTDAPRDVDSRNSSATVVHVHSNATIHTRQLMRTAGSQGLQTSTATHALHPPYPKAAVPISTPCPVWPHKRPPTNPGDHFDCIPATAICRCVVVQASAKHGAIVLETYVLSNQARDTHMRQVTAVHTMPIIRWCFLPPNNKPVVCARSHRLDCLAQQLQSHALPCHFHATTLRLSALCCCTVRCSAASCIWFPRGPTTVARNAKTPRVTVLHTLS